MKNLTELQLILHQLVIHLFVEFCITSCIWRKKNKCILFVIC